jgi:hypothetical protein
MEADRPAFRWPDGTKYGPSPVNVLQYEKEYGPGTSVQNGIPGSNTGNGPHSDDQVRAYHEQALARGDKRVLFRTVEGRLHSYAKDELGVVTASSHPQVRSAGGFLAMAVFFAAVAVFSVLLASGPLAKARIRGGAGCRAGRRGVCHSDGDGSFDGKTPARRAWDPRAHRTPVRQLGCPTRAGVSVEPEPVGA